MNKLFLDYELSAKLCMLGFNEKCCAYYLTNDGNFLFLTAHYDVMNFRIKDLRLNLFTAPTFDQALKWFRDKYFLMAIVSTFGDTDIYPKYIYEIRDLKNPMSAIENEMKSLLVEYKDVVFYDTYEEANIAAIKEMLK